MLSRLARCVSNAALSTAARQIVQRHSKHKLPLLATAIACTRGHQTLAAAAGRASASLPVAGASAAVRHVRTLERERLLQVEWEDGTCSLYPFTWLRDNCQCPHCTLQSAQARSLLLSKLDVHTGLDSVQVAKNKVGKPMKPVVLKSGIRCGVFA